MQNLIINEELKNLLPPLSDAEFKGLEEQILREGCRDRLIVWDGTLIDGHHRYAICTKHNIDYGVTEFTFSDINEAKLWIFTNQDNRRNLTPYQRGEIALKLKDTIAAKAKERQGQRTDLNNIPATLPECKETRQELAEIANMGARTLDKVEYISEHADEKTKEKLRKGEKGTSINKEHKRLKDAEPVSAKTKQKKKAKPRKNEPEVVDDPDVAMIKRAKKTRLHYECQVDFEPEPGDTTFEWLTDEEREDYWKMQAQCANKMPPPIRQYTIQHIPEHNPDSLILCLFELFKPFYRRQLILKLARRMFKDDDTNQTRELIEQLANEFQN
ncbi:MAG: hypothetical protein ACRC2T_03720 [Thermoguttaceae bacterium]